MPKSFYLDNLILNSALRGQPFTPITQVYVALYTVPPGFDTPGVEVSGSGTGYLRPSVTFSAPNNGQVMNLTDVNFPIAVDHWGTIVAFGLVDALTSGNVLYFGTLSTARLVSAADQVRFPAGQLVCQET